uniref:Uncharacterized protein n=1 Tax=Anguilla anguilla TaxID=7936 RepID=A0A0E9XE69_ANGAN
MSGARERETPIVLTTILTGGRVKQRS